jgi:hypothetical protein
MFQCKHLFIFLCINLQKDYVDTEMTVLGRKPNEISAVVGYAGGKLTGPDGKV